MARFVLIRHGESIWNGERRIQGNQDPPLSPRGRRQAELLAARLHAHLPKAAAIYTSPLRRAAETAQVVGAATGLSVIHEPDLREMRLGQWEGKTVAEMQAAHPGADLVLVSHGGPIKALVCQVLGLDVRLLFRIKQDNTAVNLVEVDETTRRLVRVNDTCHLTEAGTDLVSKDVLTDAGDPADIAP